MFADRRADVKEETGKSATVLVVGAVCAGIAAAIFVGVRISWKEEACKPLTLIEAMGDAAGRLPQFPERWGRGFPELERAYIESLRGGTMTIRGGRLRRVSEAFAGHLSDEHRETWLRGAYEGLIEDLAGKRIDGIVAGSSGGACAFAAIYHLTTDPELKTRAYDQWFGLVKIRFEEENARYARRERMPIGYPVNKPEMPMIGECWTKGNAADAPENRP